MESSEYSPKSIDSRANAVQRVSQPSQQQTSVQGPLQRTIDGSPRQTAQRQQIVTSGSNGLSTSEPIQRKAVFKNPDSENIKTLKNKIISQLQLKNNLFNKKEKEHI